MCECRNIEIGSYDNQVNMTNWWNGKIVCVDECIWKEIHFLWDNEVRTTGCCCGHNKVDPMINVVDKDHEKMIELGYNYSTNRYGVKCYVPLSVTKQID